MHINNPYSHLHKHWFRGNLHTHSNKSDGKLSPKDVIKRYSQAGYNFLAITDHSKFTDVSSFSTEEFLLINGEELSDPHVLALGITEEIPDPTDFRGIINSDRLIEEIDAIHQQKGLPVIAHPYWSGITSEILREIKHEYMIEIYNAVCDIEWHKGYSVSIWDELLSRNRGIMGIAVDDCHFIKDLNDFAQAWIMVNTDELSWNTLSAALKAGRFFSTQGPQIRSIETHQNKVQIQCSPCKSIAFIGRSYFGQVKYGNNVPLTSAEYEIKSDRDQGFLRIVCCDELGRYAWSNPLTLTA